MGIYYGSPRTLTQRWTHKHSLGTKRVGRVTSVTPCIQILAQKPGRHPSILHVAIKLEKILESSSGQHANGSFKEKNKCWQSMDADVLGLVFSVRCYRKMEQALWPTQYLHNRHSYKPKKKKKLKIRKKKEAMNISWSGSQKKIFPVIRGKHSELSPTRVYIYCPSIFSK